jgi:hypothetical protein
VIVANKKPAKIRFMGHLLDYHQSSDLQLPLLKSFNYKVLDLIPGNYGCQQEYTTR